MFEVFDTRDGDSFAYFKYESGARIFVGYVNKYHGGRLDYDTHTHSEDIESSDGPTPSGAMFVTVTCRCGKIMRGYVDSVI